MSTQRAHAIIATAEPLDGFWDLCRTYGITWQETDPTNAGIPCYVYEGTEDALRAFLGREDTWALDDNDLAEFVIVDENQPTPSDLQDYTVHVRVYVSEVNEAEAELQVDAALTLGLEAAFIKDFSIVEGPYGQRVDQGIA